MEKYEAYKTKLVNVIQVAAFIGVVVLILSPLFQWAERIYLLKTGRGLLFTEFVYNEMGNSIEIYQEMMRTIQSVVALMSKIIVGSLMIYVLLSIKELKVNWKRYLLVAVPLLLFAAYSAGIYIVTQIRGITKFDTMPHYYLGDTIFEFMRHPFTYFFCGMFVMKEKNGNVLLYIFSLSAMMLNVASMVDKWVISNRCFLGLKGSAIFNNTNHYCYYLAVAVVCMVFLFVYEDKTLYKVFYGANLALGMSAMISADSLGPYIAVVFVIILFALYCRKNDKKRQKWALFALGIVFTVNIMMSMLVDTFISSIIRTFFEIGEIIGDPTENMQAGSGRWELWHYAVENIVKHPLVGWGVEGYAYGGTAHNEILQYTENFGIPVTLLHIAAVSTVMVMTYINRKKLSKKTILCFGCTLSYIISAMLGVAIFYTTPFFYVFLGLTYAEVAKDIITGETSSSLFAKGE